MRFTKQFALKPLDLVVLLKLACHRGREFTYGQFGTELGITASEAHSSIQRCRLARLVDPMETAWVEPSRSALLEFVIYGAKYAFPPLRGPVTPGTPTAYAAPPLREIIVQPTEPPPVWPHSDGPVLGQAFYPLHPRVPAAVAIDRRLYEILALFDALRGGSAREREAAIEQLRGRI
jgi:hypothetical protein